MPVDQRRAAEMLLVGFVRALEMRNVAALAGYDVSDEEQLTRMGDECPFLRINRYERRTPVRAFVANHWPKLADYLVANEKNPKKVLAVAAKVAKLSCDPEKHSGSRFSYQDLKEIRDAREAMSANSSSYRLSREAFKSNQRSAWNVCKA